MASLRTAANRVARHFEGVLRKLNTMYREGGAPSGIAIRLFDEELPSIQNAREEVARLMSVDRDAATACASFARGGAALIHLRLHPRERIRWIEAGMHAVDEASDAGLKARMSNDLGLCYAAIGESDRATECYRRALDLSNREEEGPLIAALGNLANLYLRTGKPDEAIELLTQVVEFCRKTRDDRKVADALNSLGAAYKDKQDYTRSIDFHQQALELHRKINDRRGEGSALVNLGVSSKKSGHALAAIEYYEQALIPLRMILDKRGESDALWNMSLALREIGNVEIAIQCARNALAIRERLEDPRAAKIRERLRVWEAGETSA